MLTFLLTKKLTIVNIISQTTKKAHRPSPGPMCFCKTARSIMNVKTFSNKHKVTGVTAIAVLVALSSCEYRTANSSVPSNYSYESEQVVASEYELLAVKKTGEKSGEAVIRIDGFKLNVSFDFDGVAGSDFTTAEITNLAIDSVTDLSGKSFNDFTNHDDHKNINILLAGYIDRNNWLEAA